MRAPDAALRLLGLAARAGVVLSGTDRVRTYVRTALPDLVLLAVDSSENSRDKLVPLLNARGVRFVTVCTRVELGEAVGRPPASALAITDAKLAARIMELLGTGGDPGVSSSTS